MATPDEIKLQKGAVAPAQKEQTGSQKAVSVIDNLLKGQSGQAIQNLNIMSGYSMDEGLELTNNFP